MNKNLGIDRAISLIYTIVNFWRTNNMNLKELDEKCEKKYDEFHEKLDDEIDALNYDFYYNKYKTKYSNPKYSTKSLKRKQKQVDFAADVYDDVAYRADIALDKYCTFGGTVGIKALHGFLALAGAALITLGALTIANNNQLADTFIQPWQNLFPEMSKQQIGNEFGGNLVAVGGIVGIASTYYTKKGLSAVYTHYQIKADKKTAKSDAIYDVIAEREGRPLLNSNPTQDM